MAKKSVRGVDQKVMAVKTKIRRSNLIEDNDVQQLIEQDCKLLTSKQLAEILRLKSAAALRKQRSNGRSLFVYCRLGRRIFYPMDMIMKTLNENKVVNELR